ncbi:MAG: hypothetical protein H6R18_3064 [Proteobacteria bacterium]|nr:hypothetical protein [Pseudomonadota bacterium]
MKRTILLLAAFFALHAQAQTGAQATVQKIAQSDTLLKQAEVSLGLSDGRMVVGYLGGLSEIRKNGSMATVVPLKVPAVTGCYYAGLVEHQGYLYASCTTNWGKYNAKPMLIGAPITADLSQTTFTIIAQPTGIYGSNGLAFDGKSFYLADSGMFNGKIVQIKLSAPLKTETQKTVYTSKQRPNGIRYDAKANALYFTENSAMAGFMDVSATLSKVSLKTDGTFGTVTKVYSQKGYFDAPILTQTGFVMADPLKQKVFHVNETSQAVTMLAEGVAATSVGFACPNCNSLIATDMSKHAVFEIVPFNTLTPR